MNSGSARIPVGQRPDADEWAEESQEEDFDLDQECSQLATAIQSGKGNGTAKAAGKSTSSSKK